MNHASRFHKYLLLPLTVILMFGVLGSDCKKSSTGPDTKPDTMTGNDGKVYQTVTIGNQVWMAENLRETKYRNGDAIPNVTNDTEWTGLSTGARCAYNNSETTANTYGYLYNWYAAVDARNIAPAGWKVPSDADWTALTNYLIANGYNWDGTTSGNKIGKSLASKSGWQSSGTEGAAGNNQSTNNSSGFTALPGGYRYDYYGYFSYLGRIATFWSATESNTYDAWNRYLSYNYSEVGRHYYNKHYGFSVRLVRE